MIIKQNSYSGHLLQMGKKKPKMEEEEIRYRELDLKVLERERETYLKNTGRFDRRNFSKQEAKLLYTTRPMRGLRFWQFLTNSMR